MRWFERKNGISVLVACQNEEAVVALCLLSFLEFGDELIVVDNGSTDRTKEIAQDLASMYPNKIKFYDAPELPDLYHNRQLAFSKSSYRWIVRCDSDYVAYTDGEYNIMRFREMLLSQKKSILPRVYAVPQVNVVGDFWHTGPEAPRQRYVQRPISSPMLRIYEVFPSFKFKRLGRWEGVRFQWFLDKTKTVLAHPLWMQCTLKSNRHHLFRSERTNWRELGDYDRYPTLESYLLEVIQQKYNTKDIDEAADLFMEQKVFPFLQKYDPEKYYPYPRLVREQMDRNCIYKITKTDGKVKRNYFGVKPLLDSR
jgi:glycosyltransferase involved in cell wall biosynthesis